MFLAPLGKTKEEINGEVNNGRYPPCILYKIIFTSPEEKRVKPALVQVVLHGANPPLSFCCRIQEEMCECVDKCSVCGGKVHAHTIRS